MIKPIKLNYPYLHNGLLSHDGIPYRGITLIGEIQNSHLDGIYNKIYKLDRNNKHPSDRLRLLIQKKDQNNDYWINNGTYRDD